jgi:hypothetical protein
MERAELLARLRAAPAYDAAVLRLGEADYGCEERPDDAPELVWLLLLLADGSERAIEYPAATADRLGLTDGCLCRLSDVEQSANPRNP